MSNSNFCDECGCYILHGQEEVLIGNGGFKIVCKRCHRRKPATLAADTGQKEAKGVTLEGVGANNG
jgi:hypothetical protein